MTGLLGWRVSKGASGTRCFYLNLFPLPCRDVRVTFDPHSVAEIAPHITLVYENEITSAAYLKERLTEISGAINPFRLRLSEPRTWASGPEGGFICPLRTWGEPLVHCVVA
jgi:hypothetical protein